MATTIKKGLLCRDGEFENGVFPYTGVDCVFDDNGNALSKTITAIDEEIDDAGRVLDDLNKKVGSDLLWTNANSTSTFGAQTLQLDFKGYRFLNITFRQVYSGSYFESVIAPTDTSAKYMTSGVRWDGSSNWNIARSFGVFSSGAQISFQNAYRFNTYASGTMDNVFLIPFKIYGIK